MTINQSRLIQLILGICVYFTTSCTGCNQKQIGRGRDQAILKIETQAVNVLGSIDKTNLVLDVVGKIEINEIKESSVLCVVVIPVGGSIENATNELRSIPKSLDKNIQYIPLPTNQGAAYYGMEWPSNQTGNVATRVYLKDILIPKQYEAYLVVHNILYGTYHSKQGQLFDIPNTDPANLTTIQLQSAASKRVVDIPTGESFVEIMAQAGAQNFGTMGGGFLFIEKKDIKVNPDSLLAEAIKGGRIVPTVNEFNLFTTNPDVIVHSFVDMAKVVLQAQANNNINSRDVLKLFKKGGTYQVYAYLMHTVNGQVHYILSKDDIEINIYKPEVELALEKVKIINMIKDLSSPKNMPVEDYNDIRISLRGKLTKHVNTFNPQIGFLFIAGGTAASSDDAKNKITSFLTANPGSIKQDALHKHGDDLVYIARNITSGLIGNVDYEATSNNILLKLGKQYTIYFWLQDGGGEVFVSSNSKTIAVPSVDLTINKFTTYRILNNFYVDRLEHIAVNGSDISFWGCWGYILVAKGQNFDKLFLTSILQEEKNKRAKHPKTPDIILAHHPMISIRSDIGFVSGSQSPTNLMNKLDETFRQVPSQTEYDIYLACFNNEFIFYTKADHPDKKFVWNQPPNAIRKYQVNNIVQEDGSIKNYQVICHLNPTGEGILEAHILEKHAADNGTDEIKYKMDQSNYVLINKILTTSTINQQAGTEAIFSGSAEYCRQSVDNFIAKMPQE